MQAIKAASVSAAAPAARSGPRLSVLLTVGLGVVLFLAVGLFHVWSRVAIIEQGYALSRQRSLREEMLQEQRSLTLEIARLRDPARLEKAAQSYELAAPRPGQIVILEGR